MKDYKDLEKYLQEQLIGELDNKYHTSGLLRVFVCKFIEGEEYENKIGIAHMSSERNYICTYYTSSGEHSNLFKIEITRKKGNSHYSSYGASHTDYTIKTIKVVPFYEEKSFEDSFNRVNVALALNKEIREQEIARNLEIAKYVRDTYGILNTYSLSSLFKTLTKDCYLLDRQEYNK